MESAIASTSASMSVSAPLSDMSSHAMLKDKGIIERKEEKKIVKKRMKRKEGKEGKEGKDRKYPACSYCQDYSHSTRYVQSV